MLRSATAALLIVIAAWLVAVEGRNATCHGCEDICALIPPSNKMKALPCYQGGSVGHFICPWYDISV